MRGNFQIMIGAQNVTQDAIQYQVVRRLSHPGKFWAYLTDDVQGNAGYFGTIGCGDEINFSTQQRTDAGLVQRFTGYVDRVKCLTDAQLNFVAVEGRDALGFWNDVIVREHYADTPLVDIVTDLVGNYDPLGVATNIADPGFSVGYIQFPFMPLFDCIDLLAKIVGWSFRIDESGTFKFFNPQDPAQEQSTWHLTTNVTSVTSIPSDDLRIRRATNVCEKLCDRGLDRKVILGAGFVEIQTDTFKGDGITKVFGLSKSPLIFKTSDITAGPVNDDPYAGGFIHPTHGPVVTLAGVNQDVGIEGVDRSYDANNLRGDVFQGDFDGTSINNTPITGAKPFSTGLEVILDSESQTLEFSTAPGNGVSGVATYKHLDPAIIDIGMTDLSSPAPTVEQLQYVPPMDSATAVQLAETELSIYSGDHFHTQCETVNEDMAKPGDLVNLDIPEQLDPLPPPGAPGGGGGGGRPKGKGQGNPKPTPVVTEVKHEKKRKGDVSTSLEVNSPPSRPERIEEFFKKQRLYIGYALGRQLYGKKPPFYLHERLSEENATLTDTLEITVQNQSTLILQPDATAGLDTQIHEGVPTANYGTISTFGLRNYSSTPFSIKGLLQFDLSGIPAGATITSATLTLTTKFFTAGTDFYVTVYRVTSTWDELAVTWNTQPTVGASIATGQLASVSDTSADFDLTTAVQNWYSGAWTNYGLRIDKDVNENKAITVYSSDEATASYRPKLVIVYLA